MLALIRKVAATRGLNTAALARSAGVDRSHLKHVLSGAEPLTVDELIQLAQVLEIGATELAGLPTTAAEASPAADNVEPLARVLKRGEIDDPITGAADPLGNHAEQSLKLGLALGCDLHLVMDASLAKDSGVPRAVLAQFPERLPIRLDAAFHRHHDLRFTPQSVQMTLSFDTLYTCVFPWPAIQQVTIFPLPPPPEEDPEPEEEEEPSRPSTRRGHLRLVE